MKRCTASRTPSIEVLLRFGTRPPGSLRRTFNWSRCHRSVALQSGLTGRAFPGSSVKTSITTRFGALERIRSPQMLVHAPWRRGPSNFVKIKFTLPSPHLWRAASGPVQSNLSPILFTPANFKRILRQRHDGVGGRENVFNHELAQALVGIAREWKEVAPELLVELRRLASRIPAPLSGITDKNKRALRQFDDPAVLRRLYDFPTRLWGEVKRDRKANRYTLAKAQAALAIAIVSFIPVRLQNLAALEFDKHLFMREGARATSTLELPAAEVKNRRELAFDIPSHVAKMIIEYRNVIAPRIIGRRPTRLFVNVDGNPKNQWAVAWLIRTYLRKRAGIGISAHQFRHLSAKVLLDAEPGSFETVRQILGHASLRTTVAAYAGINSRRAGRHHQRLVEQALAEQSPVRGR